MRRDDGQKLSLISGEKRKSNWSSGCGNFRKLVDWKVEKFILKSYSSTIENVGGKPFFKF